MAEMTAVEYFKERARMTHNCKIDCDDCLLTSEENGTILLCGGFERKYPEKAIAIVQTWAEEHPQKTILQDFLEKHPNAVLGKGGYPEFCPYVLGYEKEKVDCQKVNLSCNVCWNRELEE